LLANRLGHPSPGKAGLPQAFGPVWAMNSTVGGRIPRELAGPLFARKRPTGGLSARPALGWNRAWDGSPSFESGRMIQRLACIVYMACRDAPMPGRYAAVAEIHA
jgi:hypothetical protein